MPTIQFENGKKVRFDGTPTQQDIDEVANSLGITKSASSTATSNLPVSPKETESNPLLSIVSDPIKTLLVKPADRIAETIGRTGILGKTIKQGYEDMSRKGESRSFAGIEIEPQKALGSGGGKQIIGDAAKSASYLYTGGKVPGIASEGLKGKVAKTAIQGAKTGAISGSAYGFGDSIQKEEKGFGDVLKDTLTGATVGGATGGLLGAGVPLAGQALAKRATDRKSRINNTVGQILQGETKDKNTLIKTLSEIDNDDIKTYQDLVDRVDEKVGLISKGLDDALEMNPNIKTFDNLSLETTVGGQKIKQNHVAEALDQMEQHYTKINDIPNATLIRQLREKAKAQGLTTREINNIARQHGKDLSAYNLNGELASGLSKQATENTRAGLKATSRTNFGDEISQKADAEITKLIRVRDLAQEMVEKVNDLQQRVQERGFGERVGRLLGQVIDIASGGILGSATRSLIIPRGGGLKTLNAIDLEKRLAKNLKSLQKVSDPNVTEQSIIKALEEFIIDAGKKPAPLLLPPASNSGSVNKPFILPDPVQHNSDGTLRKYPMNITTAKKNTVSANPKTGRFQTTYSSESR